MYKPVQKCIKIRMTENVFIAEPNYIQIVELLHVPLQTMYNQPQRKYKLTTNGEVNNEALQYNLN